MNLDATLHPMFRIAQIWAVRSGNTLTLVSANDHDHVWNSLHYADRALDFHSSDLFGLATALRQAGYRVLHNIQGHFFHVHSERTG